MVCVCTRKRMIKIIIVYKNNNNLPSPFPVYPSIVRGKPSGRGRGGGGVKWEKGGGNNADDGRTSRPTLFHGLGG